MYFCEKTDADAQDINRQEMTKINYYFLDSGKFAMATLTGEKNNRKKLGGFENK